MNLRRQILLTLAGILSLLVLLFAASSYISSHLHALTASREDNVAATTLARAFRYHVAQIQQFLTDVGATGESGGYAEADAQRRDAEDALTRLESLQPQEAARLADIRRLLTSFHDTGTRMAQAYVTGGQAAGNALMKAPDTGFDARGAALVAAFDPLLARLEADDAALAEALGQEQRSMSRILLGIELAILAVASASLLHLRHALLAALGGEPAEAARISRDVAEGNLRHAIPPAPSGSLLHAMGGMREQLRGFAQRTHQAIQGLDSVAGTLSGNAEALSGSAHQASTATSTMASTVEQLAASLHAISDHAEEARRSSEESGQIAMNGADIIRRSVTEMNQIDQVTRGTSAQLSTLGEESARIVGIVAVIKEVADQTNLLALNAAIEAARAGEAGRGFAVVADEVRKLAERAAASTQEIQAVVDGVNRATASAIDAMRDVEQRVGVGVGLAAQAGEAIEHITDRSQRVVGVIADIGLSLREQEQAHTELVQQMSVLADLSERNSHLAHQASESAGEVGTLSGELDQMVDWFKY